MSGSRLPIKDTSKTLNYHYETRKLLIWQRKLVTIEVVTDLRLYT